MTDKIVVAARFSDVSHAHIAKCALSAEGIHSEVTGEYLTNTRGGILPRIELLVNKLDVEEAKCIIEKIFEDNIPNDVWL